MLFSALDVRLLLFINYGEERSDEGWKKPFSDCRLLKCIAISIIAVQKCLHFFVFCNEGCDRNFVRKFTKG